ncbi:MAG TPA: DUF3052 domain-containing protein [Acidimicrobiales bacterium]|nr:DUF3052 domain-containing protein [Acidimicrobiales bacterium]
MTPPGPGGYAGTPLAAKLGIKPGHVVALVGAPRGWTVPALPDGARLRRSLGEGADVVVAFVREAARLPAAVAAAVAVLGPADALWVTWPRRAAGHDSDLTDQVVRACGLDAGLVDVKVAAVGEDWSGIRFVWSVRSRPGVTPRTGR